MARNKEIQDRYALIIIGGGSAAFAAAIEANRLGIRTLLLNAGLPIGGTCVNVGCVPSKFLLEVAHAVHSARSAFVFTACKNTQVEVDYERVQNSLHDTVEALRREKYQDVLSQLEYVTFLEGWASFLDPHTVVVDGKKLSADFFLIATGSKPAIPPIAGLQKVQYYTTDTIFSLEELPKRLLVLGGGAVGVELAQAYARCGSEVVLLELASQLLPGEDRDVAVTLAECLQRDGIELFTDAKVHAVQQNGGEIECSVQLCDGKELRVRGSHLLLATGRVGKTEQLALQRAGVEVDGKGFIPVTPYLQTTQPHIAAIGDCNNRSRFVYTAAYEGKLAVRNFFDSQKTAVDYAALPWVVFTEPQIAGVGFNEQQLRADGREFAVAKLYLDDLPRARIAQKTQGFIKLLYDPAADLLLGARIVMPNAGESIASLSLAMRNRIPLTELQEQWFPYLTYAEGIKLSILTISRDIHMLSCCAS